MSPDSLPKPAEKLDPPWFLGIWRLVESGNEFSLDSITRIQMGKTESFARHRILDAILNDEEF